jgi:MoaA/NifB/PqqE/SkfB family radical SAM enzyme
MFDKEKQEHSFHEVKVNDWLDGIQWLSTAIEPVETIDISGGEPFLYPDLIELINKIPNKIWVGLTTNGVMLTSDFLNIKEDRARRMNITASLHLDALGEIPDYFEGRVGELIKSGFMVTVNFVAYKKQVHKIPEVQKLCERIGAICHIEPHIDYSKRDFSVGEIPADIVFSFDRETFSNLKKTENRKIPSNCWIGTSYLWITPNGDIFQCLGYFLSDKPRIGNIFEKKIDRIPEKPTMCDVFCACAQNWR